VLEDHSKTGSAVDFVIVETVVLAHPVVAPQKLPVQLDPTPSPNLL
jgi:hypothetical protein